MIATDLDGTLLRSDGLTVSNRTREAFRVAQSRGIAVALLSARGIASVREIGAFLERSAFAVCSNGAEGYDLPSGTTIWSEGMPCTRARSIVTRLRRSIPSIALVIETHGSVNVEPPFVTVWPDWTPAPSVWTADVLPHIRSTINKMCAFDPRQSAESLAAVVRELFGSEVAVHVSGPQAIEIVAAGVSKRVALQRIAQSIGLERHEIVAFGDHLNDLDMLQWAGTSIAPANAHPKVRAAVGDITRSNDEDGVAIALETILETLGP